MNNTLILADLTQTISTLTGCSATDAETFLRETFQLAASQLEKAGSVTIPHVGTFVVGDETIDFAPDAELAATINAPFAAFEAIEIPDDFPESDITEEPAESIEPEAPSEAEQIADAAEFEERQDADVDVTHQQAPAEETETPARPIAPTDEPVVQKPCKRPTYWPLWMLLCAACFVAGYFVGRGSTLSSQQTITKAIDSVVPVQTDTILSEITEESDTLANTPQKEIVTDTISSTRYLTTMARKHYGQMEYWVYIYEENAAKLGHPDRLDAGTIVVIPPAEKYDLKAGDKDKIKQAMHKATEIYARFN